MTRFSFTLIVLLVATVAIGEDFRSTYAIDDNYMYWVVANDSALRIEHPSPLVEWFWLTGHTIYKTTLDTTVVDSLVLYDQYLTDRSSTATSLALDKDDNQLIFRIEEPYYTVGLNLPEPSSTGKYLLVIDCNTMDIVVDFCYSDSLNTERSYWLNENVNYVTAVVSNRAVRHHPTVSKMVGTSFDLMGRTMLMSYGTWKLPKHITLAR